MNLVQLGLGDPLAVDDGGLRCDVTRAEAQVWVRLQGSAQEPAPFRAAVRGEDEPARSPQRCLAEDRNPERLAAAVRWAVRLEPREVRGVVGPTSSSQARQQRPVLPLAQLVERHERRPKSLYRAAEGGHQRVGRGASMDGPAGHVPRPHGVGGGHGRLGGPGQPHGGCRRRDETHQGSTRCSRSARRHRAMIPPVPATWHRPDGAGWADQAAWAASSASRCSLAAGPPAYPPTPPDAGSTRWQGSTMHSGLAPSAVPTARAAPGCSTAEASTA